MTLSDQNYITCRSIFTAATGQDSSWPSVDVREARIADGHK